MTQNFSCFSDIQELKHRRLFERVCGLAWPILGRLGRLDSSSNLDRPTITHLSHGPILGENQTWFL